MFRVTLLLLSCFNFFFQEGHAYRYELAAASIFQNEGAHLQEWIEYHRMVGVEHFWLYNDKSDDNWQAILQPYIDEGIVEVTDWPSFNYKYFISNQNMAMKDAHEKAKDVAKWLAFIDLDEYLLPLQETTVTECLQNHFDDVDAVYINWYHFGTGGITLKSDESSLFTLTACSHRYHPKNWVGKSIIKTDATTLENMWTIHHCVHPEILYYNGDAEPILHNGVDLCLDAKIHDTYMRINHYNMGDEHYFHNNRVPRARGIGIDIDLVLEHYHAFNKEQNFDIINFIIDKHPEMFEKYWKHHIFR